MADRSMAHSRSEPRVVAVHAGRSDARRANSGDNLLETALRHQRLSRRRATVLGERLAGDVAWNILLDALISQRVGRRLSVTAACLGSGGPHSTALRYVRLLCEAGYLERTADAGDRRRFFLGLTERGSRAMTMFLDPGG